MGNIAELEVVKTVTMEELAAAFEGKYVKILPEDHYGISIEMTRGTVEYEDDLKPELYFVSRDDENKVTGSICIDENSIESIEKYGDTYIVNFMLCMTSVNISEYKTLQQLQKEREQKQETSVK